jgi:hypothetical protein
MKPLTLSLALAVVCALSRVPQAAGAASERPQAEETARKEGKAKEPSDAQVRQILIDESIAAYSGSCPCPYSTMHSGRRCGRRSAYSREGGAAPLCYPKDVTDAMVLAYRAESSVD